VGKQPDMQISKIIKRRSRHTANGVDLSGDINAAIAANVGEKSSVTRAVSRSGVSTESSRSGETGRDGRAEEGRKS
jgi:hypothetical protein